MGKAGLKRFLPLLTIAGLLLALALTFAATHAKAQETVETTTTTAGEQPVLGKADFESLVEECKAYEKKYGIMPEATSYERVVGPKVLIIRIEGTIDNAMLDYLKQSIERAEEENAVLIVELNTPGGFVDAATEMVVAISKARIPVVGYVVEKWAESAGTMILMSTHIAAMQPGTIIGSVQPIAYDPTTGSYQPVLDSKIINPIVKTLCEHGATRGRNPEALVRFVLYNDNYGAEEALEKGVIDLIARDRSELLQLIDGKVVRLPIGETVLIDVNGSYEVLEPDLRIRFLHSLSDPMLSGILLSIGALALLFSIASGNLPGIALGGFLLVLGLVGSGFNPNTAALILIIGGAILVFIELYTPGFGIIGGTGIAMLVFGVILLPIRGEGFAVGESYAKTLLYTTYALGATMGGLTAFVVYKVVKAKRAPQTLWKLKGAIGEAVDDIPEGGTGFILVEGEYWKAKAVTPVARGDKVVVVDKEGPYLVVKKAGESVGEEEAHTR
ncbi:serine protease [Aeropyrum pernix]|uniref:Serine protease n=1 Tax=Aeropyrum pernix TaxID=56636 RepID=A0A401H922_AERPX|nr:nodulation protein NfeD [Aeropyrum pernix]GBF08868.1 serine protease [Aeropyrum pernix]